MEQPQRCIAPRGTPRRGAAAENGSLSLALSHFLSRPSSRFLSRFCDIFLAPFSVQVRGVEPRAQPGRPVYLGAVPSLPHAVGTVSFSIRRMRIQNSPVARSSWTRVPRVVGTQVVGSTGLLAGSESPSHSPRARLFVAGAGFICSLVPVDS